ncbi:galactose mutarotase [Sphingomonas koreensis]|nr:galactose mutarotase [Sphingomonas koreensis]
MPPAMIQLSTAPLRLHDGREAAAYVLHADDGITVRLSSLGATLMAIEAPDRQGVQADVLLGWADPARYDAASYRRAAPYFGATVGRYANRIAGAGFTIDGEHFSLSANENGNHLHGGKHGFDRRIWSSEPIADGIRFNLVSANGDQGYPGRLSASADFVLSAADELTIRYTARTDRPTHVNLVSHGYFNLTGVAGSSIVGHILSVDAGRYAPIDAASLPLGQLADVTGTPFDFRAPVRLGDALDAIDRIGGGGLNHCLALTASGCGARLHDPLSGRILEIATDQPGLQLYSGDGLDGTLRAADGEPFARRSGLCLEAQHFPDSPNQPGFPSTRLDPGALYVSETRLRFSTDAA